jgi:hypothetical protein
MLADLKPFNIPAVVGGVIRGVYFSKLSVSRSTISIRGEHFSFRIGLVRFFYVTPGIISLVNGSTNFFFFFFFTVLFCTINRIEPL